MLRKLPIPDVIFSVKTPLREIPLRFQEHFNDVRGDEIGHLDIYKTIRDRGFICPIRKVLPHVASVNMISIVSSAFH